jgi:hypothetical protein
MGIKISAETRADLRGYWVKMIAILFVAFAILLVINLLSGDDGLDCPPQTLCTQRDMERWLGVDLPLSAEGVRFRSDPGSIDLWLTFTATPLEITQFMGHLSLQPGDGSIPEPRPDWWPDAPDLIAYQALSSNRTFFALVDQVDAAQWMLYLYGVAVE